MKNIKECFEGIQDITPYLRGEERIDEGLKEIFNAVKSKIKNAFLYLKGIVAKFGTYFLALSEDGQPLPAITPLTAGAAYVDGSINKKSTFVKLDKEGAKITGCKSNFDDAYALYGKGNSIEYWRQLLKESNDESFATILEYFNTYNSENQINEVKMHTDDPEAKYNIIVDDVALKDRIKVILKNKKLAKLLIWGAPGIGKTAILMNVLEEMKSDFPNYQLIVKTLSNETPDNFTLPKYASEVNDEDFEDLAKTLGREPSAISKLLKKVGIDKAIDIPKTWLPVYKPTGDAQVDALLDEKCGSGLLFVDELSRATPQVLNVVLPIVNEGLFNGYRLGSGWTIVCASNRPEDETSGQSTISNALANRFIQVHYEPTVHTWRKWADKQNFISPVLLQWLSMPEEENMSGGKFYYMDPNEDANRQNDTTLMCTPRAWTNAMRLLATYHHTGKLEGFNIFDIPTDIIASTLNSCIPASAIDGFLEFLKVISKIGNFDHAVREVWTNSGKNLKIDKKSLNLIVLPLGQLVCSAHADKLPTEKEFESLCDWVVSQNSDQLASCVLDVFGNVFLGDIEKDMRGQFLTMQERIRRTPDRNKLKSFEALTKDTCTRWGISFDEIPDYMPGLKKLVGKYGASFKAAVVGDHDAALG